MLMRQYASFNDLPHSQMSRTNALILTPAPEVGSFQTDSTEENPEPFSLDAAAV